MRLYKCHFIAFVVLCVLLYIFMFVVEPIKKGFFCDDKSIRLPYNEQSTVGFASVLILCTSLTLLSIFINQICRTNNLEILINYMIFDIIPWTFGEILNGFITAFVKTIVGRLRPYFIEFCKPNVQCFEVGTNRLRKGIYIENFECTNNIQKSSLFESQLSFYCAHAAVMAYSMTYLIFYVQDNMQRLPPLLRAFIQCLLLTLTCLVSYSRISDYHHHPSDVLVGFLVGTFIAIFVYLCITPHYLHRRNNSFNISGLDLSPWHRRTSYSMKRFNTSESRYNRSSLNSETARLTDNELHPLYQTI